MKQYIISAIMLYALFVVVYLLWERIGRRKQNAAKKSSFNPFRAAPKEDIVGKSKFDLRHSLPQATTLKNSDKEMKNSDTFAGETEKKTSAAIPLDQLDAVFSTENNTDEKSNEINLEIENTPPEFEPDYGKDDLDEEETEDEDTEGFAGVSLAQGLGFDELAGTFHTVNNEGEATSDEREEAGRVLVELRQTDMFEQIVSEESKKKVVSSLMDNYFAAFRRRKREAGEVDESTVKAPNEFDVRSFA